MFLSRGGSRLFRGDAEMRALGGTVGVPLLRRGDPRTVVDLRARGGERQLCERQRGQAHPLVEIPQMADAEHLAREGAETGTEGHIVALVPDRDDLPRV